MRNQQADNVMSATDYEGDMKREKEGKPPLHNKIYPLTDIEDGAIPIKTKGGKGKGTEDEDIRQIEAFANAGRRDELKLQGADFMS